MSSDNGLIGSSAYRKPGVPYYLEDGGEAVLRQPTLVAPITLESFDEQAQASLSVSGFEAGAPYPYTGAVRISPGGSSLGPTSDGITVRSVAGGAQVEIGTDSQTVNNLMIAGAQGLSRVYDETYNQPVSLQGLTITNVSATNVYDVNNPGEFFRCTQAGVAASVAAAIGCTVRVPRTGWYMVAAEFALQNGPAPAPTTVNVPIDNASGYNIGETLTMGFYGPTPAVTATPYSIMDIGALDFSQSQILTAGDGPVRQYTWMQLFDSTQTYRFLFKASSPNWNIGAVGQIKAELIAMC